MSNYQYYPLWNCEKLHLVVEEAAVAFFAVLGSVWLVTFTLDQGKAFTRGIRRAFKRGDKPAED